MTVLDVTAMEVYVDGAILLIGGADPGHSGLEEPTLGVAKRKRAPDRYGVGEAGRRIRGQVLGVVSDAGVRAGWCSRAMVEGGVGHNLWRDFVHGVGHLRRGCWCVARPSALSACLLRDRSLRRFERLFGMCRAWQGRLIKVLQLRLRRDLMISLRVCSRIT